MTRRRGLLDRYSASRTFARRSRRATEEVSTSSGSEGGGPEAEHAEHNPSDYENPASAPPLTSLSKQQFGVIDRELCTHFLGYDRGL